MTDGLFPFPGNVTYKMPLTENKIYKKTFNSDKKPYIK